MAGRFRTRLFLSDKDVRELSDGKDTDAKDTDANANEPGADPSTPASLVRRKSSIGAPRFEVVETSSPGAHRHSLKNTKRQDKIATLVKDFLGLRRSSSAIAYQESLPSTGYKQPPSLMATLVQQIQSGQQDPLELVAQASAEPPSAFFDKYGTTQEVIGRGSFGTVRIAHKLDPENRQLEHLYAVKEFRKRPQENQAESCKRLTSEFCISSSLHHQNIIHTLDLLQDSRGLFCEVMEFCSGGDLYSLVLAAGKLDVTEADCFFKQIVRGVNYMHEMGIAHLDLKPENVLLTGLGSVKITDFGNAECFRMAWEKDVHFSTGLCGSGPYIAPEQYTDRNKGFDPRAVDIWALGVIYMAMRTGHHLWNMAVPGRDEFYDKYILGRKGAKGYEPIEGLKRARCRNVVYSILDPVPNRRITAKQILQSEWGRDIVLCEAGEKGL